MTDEKKSEETPDLDVDGLDVDFDDAGLDDLGEGTDHDHTGDQPNGGI